MAKSFKQLVKKTGNKTTKKIAKKRTRELLAQKGKNIIVKCVVACRNAEGSSDFYFCKVECDENQHDLGYHYEVAEEMAVADGYEGPYVVFDENDGPSWLFDHFVWESASVRRSPWL